jgi:hypothetical protein
LKNIMLLCGCTLLSCSIVLLSSTWDTHITHV